MLDTRGIWQRAAKQIFELPEGENDAVGVPIRKVIVERHVLVGDLDCPSKCCARMPLRRGRLGSHHMSHDQLPTLDPRPQNHHEVNLGSQSLDCDPRLEFGEIDADA
ncbi:MAG TPA: hypothetical protein VIZ32_01950, partial [Vicinamibacterales bacterium]